MVPYTRFEGRVADFINWADRLLMKLDLWLDRRLMARLPEDVVPLHRS